MAIAGQRRALLAYDNLSAISSEQSDVLCRVATNFGSSQRTLFSDSEETTFDKRSAIIEILEPPQLPIGTKVKLSVLIDKRIDGQTGKVTAILAPTLRRVRWQLWEGAIERNFQLSYLREVAA
jgi:hypothetical protein